METTSLSDILHTITEIVEEYESGAFLSEERLMQMQRELSANMYYMTVENVQAFNKWNAILYGRPDGESIRSAETRANDKVPELRMTRKILEAARGVAISMNNQLDILKRE